MEKNIRIKSDTAIEKQNIRKRILALRDEMPLTVREEKSRRMQETLFSMELYRKTEVLLSYVEYQSEVMTTPLLKAALAAGKKVFVPKVTGEDMEFYRISDLKALAEGYKNIREPTEGEAFAGQCEDALMLMPGAVFDRYRHRIGYGKGFYDRYIERLLQTEIKLHTLALCFSCQVLDEIPYEEHDIRPDAILTEEAFYE